MTSPCTGGGRLLVRLGGRGSWAPSPHLPGPAAPFPQTVEFSLDSLAALQHKGFTIEPSKGSVERGQTRTLSISWAPPADFDVGARAGCGVGLGWGAGGREAGGEPGRAAGWAWAGRASGWAWAGRAAG